MTPFQYISITILSVLAIREFFGLWKTNASRGIGRWVRGAIWLAAAVAIFRPDLIQVIAEQVGVQRGADFVFYLFVLLFFGVSFYFYSRFVRMQRQITQLIRQLAIQEAQLGGEDRIAG